MSMRIRVEVELGQGESSVTFEFDREDPVHGSGPWTGAAVEKYLRETAWDVRQKCESIWGKAP